MTKQEAIEILNKNAPKSDPRLCALELCSAIHVVTLALQEQDHRCANCRNGDFSGVMIYCLLHSSVHRLDEYCSEWEEE